MNAFSIAGLLFVAIPAIIVGPFTLIKGRKKVHLLWSAFLSSVALWGFGMYEIGTATNPSGSLFWWHIAEIGVIFIPVFLVHFVIVFLDLKRKWLLIIFYIATFIFLYFNIFTNYFIDKLYFAFHEFYYISATPLYTAFICVFGVSVFYIVFELNRALKRTSGIIKHQIRYLIIAFSVGFLGGFTSYPPVYHIAIYPVWNATIFFAAITVAYAILRYRLMDVRIVARKALIYSASGVIVYGMFYVMIWLYGSFLGGPFTSSSYVFGIFAALIFVVIFVWFYGNFEKIADKYFFFNLYNYQKTISNLSARLNYINDLDEIINLIVDTVKNTLQLNRAGVLLVDQAGPRIHYKIAKVIGFDEHNGISLVQDNFLTKQLEEGQKPLIREELALMARDSNSAEDKKGFLELDQNMKHIEASLCLPLITNRKLMGIIVLGSKTSGDAYTKEDLDLLSTLSYQAGIAIDSARLYREIQNLNKNLQQKVDEQTKDIREAYEAEKQAKEKIDATRVEDEAVLSSIGDGVIAVDKEGKVMFINQATEQMLGINAKDVIGNPYEEFLHIENEKGEALPKEKNRIQDALALGKKTITSATGSADSVYYYVRPDKSKFPVAVTIAPIVLNGKITGAVDVFRDVTVERQIDKSKSEFVSLASHQLRTPLSAIKWYSEILMDGKKEKPSARQRKYLKEIHHGNERMIKLIDVLLNVSRIEAGKIKSMPVEIDVKKMMEDIIKEQKFDIKKKKQNLTFDCPEGLPKIFVDPNLVRMVFQNIISNAVKYTPNNGKIICVLSKKNEDILFEISDTGIGIPEDQQKRVFEKLFRANNAFPHDPEGNGLGLYVAKTTVENFGGKIWFKSKEGEGTKFYVTLPFIAQKQG